MIWLKLEAIHACLVSTCTRKPALYYCTNLLLIVLCKVGMKIEIIKDILNFKLFEKFAVLISMC